MFTVTASSVFRGLAAAFLAAVLTAASIGPAAALEPNEFDPADLDSLLSLYVKDGGVDYAGWKAAGTEALDGFLERAAGYDMSSTLGKEPRAAFLINAYNAWAIRMVIEHYPVAGLKDIPGFFDENAVTIAGKKRTLNDIETRLGEILSHAPGFAFALAPGAVGMPAPPSRAYTSDDFHGRLAEAASAYFQECGCLFYDREENVVHLPTQFQTHWELFEKQPKGIVNFIARHLALADVMAITKNKPDYVFDTVDWTLRDASGETGGEGEDGGR